MKPLATVIVVSLATAFLPAQKLELKFDALAVKATEKAEVDLEGSSLQAARSLAGNLPAQLAGLTELHVRHYEFTSAGAYNPAELDHLRKQVGPNTGWKRIVKVKDKTDDVEIYVLQEQDKVRGLLVLAAEPDEVNVVHMAGEIGEDKLREFVKSNIQYDLGHLFAGASPTVH